MVDAGPEPTYEEKKKVSPWASTAIHCDDFIDILYFQLKGIQQSREMTTNFLLEYCNNDV